MEKIHNLINDKMFAFLTWPNNDKILPLLKDIIKHQNLTKQDMKGGFVNIDEIIYYK